VAGELLTGSEEAVWGDSAYLGIGKRFPTSKIRWNIAMRYGRRRRLAKDSPARIREKEKASVRARIEHPFRDIKQRFSYAKVRYRGLHRNAQRLYLLLGFSNLLRSESQIAAMTP
jgi:IS5 family transposase